MDSDDAEDWLAEEGIGHYDESGNFQWGPDPYDGSDLDIPDRHSIDVEEENSN